MSSRYPIPLCTLVASILFAAPAVGAGQYSSMSNLPAEQKQGDVTYLMGGIGKEEASAMRKEESHFPLTLEFLKQGKPHAEYLTGVGVTIKDHEGKTVLNTVADGPLLLAKLPDGRYSILATNGGMTKDRAVVVAARKPERVVFEW